MIHDSLRNCQKYVDLHPLFQQAFDFLTHNDLEALPLGKVSIVDTDLVVNIAEITGKTEQEARMETHRRFIDIQVPIGSCERMGWKTASQLTNLTQAYDETKDVAFYADKATSFLDVQPYEFAIFFPEDGHQPGIGSGTFRKIIVKIKV